MLPERLYETDRHDSVFSGERVRFDPQTFIHHSRRNVAAQKNVPRVRRPCDSASYLGFETPRADDDETDLRMPAGEPPDRLDLERRELLGDTLKARGATVEYATCYQRSKPNQDVSALLAAKPDAITVTSSEALGYLWQMLTDSDRAALRNTPLFAPHARIAGLAREQGWQHVHLTGSGDDGLISALIAWGS